MERRRRRGDLRTIQGELLKFADWRYTKGKQATPVAIGTQLIAMATAAMWVRWENGRPAEYRIRQPGGRLPERFELDQDDASQWEIGRTASRRTRGKIRGRLSDRSADGRGFHFQHSSEGGRSAVNALADQITRMRLAHPGVMPVVELQAEEMPTKYGRKSKPVFKIVGWRGAASGPTEEIKEIEPPTRAREMDDEIPF